MKINKAIRLAIQAIEYDLQRLAVAANLYEHYGAQLPHTITAARQRKEYLEAIEILKALEEQTYSVNKDKKNANRIRRKSPNVRTPPSDQRSSQESRDDPEGTRDHQTDE